MTVRSSTSLAYIGGVKMLADDPANALTAYKESLTIFHDLAKDKSNAEEQSGLAANYAYVAEALEKLDKFKDALPYEQDALAISEELAKDYENNEKVQSNLATALKRAGKQNNLCIGVPRHRRLVPPDFRHCASFLMSG